jgi:hypothetical protein
VTELHLHTVQTFGEWHTDSEAWVQSGMRYSACADDNPLPHLMCQCTTASSASTRQRIRASRLLPVLAWHAPCSPFPPPPVPLVPSKCPPPVSMCPPIALTAWKEEKEEEGEGLFKADALNEEDPERDRATQV